MAQQMKAPVTKPEDSNYIPGDQSRSGKGDLIHASCPLIFIRVLACAHAHTYMHTLNKYVKKIKRRKISDTCRLVSQSG